MVDIYDLASALMKLSNSKESKKINRNTIFEVVKDAPEKKDYKRNRRNRNRGGGGGGRNRDKDGNSGKFGSKQERVFQEFSKKKFKGNRTRHK